MGMPVIPLRRLGRQPKKKKEFHAHDSARSRSDRSPHARIRHLRRRELGEAFGRREIREGIARNGAASERTRRQTDLRQVRAGRWKAATVRLHREVSKVL